MPLTPTQIAEATDLCLEAQAKLDGGGSYRVRVLLEMVLIELATLTARQPPAGLPEKPAGSL